MILQSENVSWFIGVVEDRLDPLQQGRVRVRAVGVHPFSRIQGQFSGMSVEDLPWMTVLQPSTSAGINGISSPITGLVNGSSVFGMWLDKYKTNGIVLGTYTGNQTNIPNPEEGFSDPMGQYPNSSGPDINGLNAGGAYGDSTPANVMQDANSSNGLWPNGAENSNPDDAPDYTIEKMLQSDEGVKNSVYWVEGLPHIGVGHLILRQHTRDMGLILAKLSKDLGKPVGSTITQADVSKLFKEDIARTQAEIKKHKVVGPVYMKMNRSRQLALENMAYQMATGGLAKFKGMLSAMASGDFETAYKQAKQSLWAKQTPGRANRISLVIKNGNLASYGIKPKVKIGKMVMNSTFMPIADTFAGGFDPYDPHDTEIYPDYNVPVTDGSEGDDLSVPYVREPSAVLFEEPKSSYQGQYPYVKASVTESGHVQEFDDTPGFERYRLVHPSGSYVEVAPDGRKTDKNTGDLYSLTNGSRNNLTNGELNVNVGGVETYINFSSVNRDIDGDNNLNISGNNNIVVSGNEVKKITGSGTIEVSGDIKIIVSGNANINVSSNADITVGGNLNTNVSGNYDITCGSFNVNSSGTANISAPKVNLG